MRNTKKKLKCKIICLKEVYKFSYLQFLISCIFLVSIKNMISNYLVEFEIFTTSYIIGGSLVAYQIGYVADRCPRRQFLTLISQ